MKKILLFLFLIPVFAAAQKTTGGNYTYIAQRYEWLTGIFQALGMPAGDSAQHKTGQDMRSGAVYLDTVNTQASPAGFYIYKNGIWELQADEDICQNRLIDPITVTYTGTGMRFFVSGGRYQIGCNFYYLDSATVTLADGEADPRIDAIILTASGVDTLKGVAAASPVKPQVDGDQIELTFVNIAAAATTPTIITHIIYDENTESTVTNTGTTTDPDNTSNVYRLTKSINVTNINNNDFVHFTLPAQINVQEYDAISGFVDLKAVMSGAANIRVRFFNGATAVSNELIITINKNSTNWQGWSVPISNFTFSNTYADRVNIRYTNTVTTVHSGFYLDYIHLAGGFTQPGGGGTSNPMTMGALDGKPANSKGATIESDVLYLQTATDSLPGLLSPTLHEKLNNQKWEYFITNLGTLGDSLATPVNDSTVAIKKLVAGTNITLTDTDTTIEITSSGGGSTPTLQQVFDTEVGGSVLTKTDTIDFNSNRMVWLRMNQILMRQDSAVANIPLLVQMFGNTSNVARFTKDGSETNTVRNDVLIQRMVQGVGAAGLGAKLTLEAESSTANNPLEIGSFAARYINPQHHTVGSSGESEIFMTGYRGVATADTFMNIQKDLVRINNNADTLATKAYARSVGGGGGGSGTVNSGTQYRLGYYATTGTAISEAPAITANRALISDANGVPTHSATTATELGYVSGVTSAIQTQLSDKVTKSKVGPDFVVTNDSLFLQNAINVKKYGAAGDGVTNDQPAITAAIAAMSATQTLYFPAGNYKVNSTVTVNKSITIVGEPFARINISGNFSAFTLSANNIKIHKLSFLGSGKGGANTSQIGIDCNGSYYFDIAGCEFYNLNGIGLYWLNTTVGSTRYGGRVSNCYFNSNNVGFQSGASGEYVTVTGGTAQGNNIGGVIIGGNVNISNMSIVDNGVGLEWRTGTNNGHGSVTGCLINHNTTYNIQMADNPLGVSFSGCQMFDSYIWLKNTKGVVFSGCELAPIAWYFENSTNTNITGNTFYDGYGFTINNNYNSTTSSTYWSSNVELDGTGLIGGNNIANLSGGSGFGDVTKVGTPVNNQVGVWTGNGTIEGGTNLTWDGTLLDVTAASAASTGEQIFKMDVSDDANSYFSIENGTTINSRFSPMFIGETGTNAAQWGLYFLARVTAAIETGTTPIMIFDSRRTTAGATTRPTFSWRNFGVDQMQIEANGNVGIGLTGATAKLHLKAGTATASTAPLKFTSGTNLTTPEAGAVEFDGTNYFATSSTTRYTLAKTLTNTATLDFGSTAAGAKTDLTITVTGAADGDVVSVGVPNGSVPDNGSFSAWVSAANTVTVRYINNDLTNAKDPASGTFRVSVVKY